MSQNRKKYSREFKIEAVKLVTLQGYSFSQAARIWESENVYSGAGKNN